MQLKTRVPADSITHVWVTTDFTGPGFARSRHTFYLRYGFHLATGPVPSECGRAFRVQVANPSHNAVRLPAGAKIGFVENYEGRILAVSPETLANLGGETPPAKETPPEPEVDIGAVPDHLVQRLQNLLTKYHTLWDGSLGIIRQTEHRIQLKAGATPVLKRCGDRGWGTTVKWLSGLSLCVLVRTCFVGCPKDRPPLPTESTSQIVPTRPSAPLSRAHTDAHALAPNRITHQIKSH